MEKQLGARTLQLQQRALGLRRCSSSAAPGLSQASSSHVYSWKRIGFSTRGAAAAPHGTQCLAGCRLSSFDRTRHGQVRNILGWRENVGFRPSFELDRSPRWSPFPFALTAARPTARSFPERWPAVPPWGTYCGPRPPTRARAARVAPQYAREAETPKWGP